MWCGQLLTYPVRVWWELYESAPVVAMKYDRSLRGACDRSIRPCARGGGRQIISATVGWLAGPFIHTHRRPATTSWVDRK